MMAAGSGDGSAGGGAFPFDPPPFEVDDAPYDAPAPRSNGGNGHSPHGERAAAQPAASTPEAPPTKSATPVSAGRDEDAAPRSAVANETVREGRDLGYGTGPAKVSEAPTVVKLRRAADRAPAQTFATPAPPEPPTPPATLYITLRRTGNNHSDFETLENLHRLLRVEQGSDQFIVILEGPEQKRIELEFPTERTQCTADLQRQIISLVGDGNLRVVEQQRPW
jgi:hypothetical protein